MSEHLPERDWKRWQQLAPILLSRFCEAVVANSATFERREESGHEKFLALHQFIGESNDHIAVVFDNRRRSSALIQIAATQRREIDEVRSDAERERAGGDEISGRLQRDAAGRYQLDLRQGSLQRFQVGRASD